MRPRFTRGDTDLTPRWATPRDIGMNRAAAVAVTPTTSTLLHRLGAPLAVLLLVALLGVHYLGERDPTVPLPPPTGHRIRGGLDVAVVIDDSGSTRFTDPADRRLAATKAVIGYLAKLAPGGGGDRVSVCRFGSSAEQVLPLTPATNTEEINDALEDQGHRGGTNIPDALQSAQRALGPKAPGRKQVILLFTDGLLDDQTAAMAAIDRQLRDASRVRTHLVALDETGTVASVLPQWQALPLTSVTWIRDLDHGDLELALARTVVAELGMHWTGTSPTPAV